MCSNSIPTSPCLDCRSIDPYRQENDDDATWMKNNEGNPPLYRMCLQDKRGSRRSCGKSRQLTLRRISSFLDLFCWRKITTTSMNRRLSTVICFHRYSPSPCPTVNGLLLWDWAIDQHTWLSSSTPSGWRNKNFYYRCSIESNSFN